MGRLAWVLKILIFCSVQIAQAGVDTTGYDAFVTQMQQTQANFLAAQQAQQQALQSQLQKTMTLQILFQYCPLMFKDQKVQAVPGAQKTRKNAYQVMDAAWKAREQEGYIYEKDLDQDLSKEIGHDTASKFAKGCDQFMNQEGKMGPWGSWALQQIKDEASSFGEKIPDDITQWCPNYPKMSQNQRELFWVWTMMSMASSESSCDPKNDNKNAPNGTAVGLFQLSKNVCKKSRDLHNPYENITCAVNLLANELENRDTLMTPTSKGEKGTYWGPLRSDDWNKARGGDIQGAQKTRSLMAEYRYCKGSAAAPEASATLSDASAKSDSKEAASSDSSKDKTKKATSKKRKPAQK